MCDPVLYLWEYAGDVTLQRRVRGTGTTQHGGPGYISELQDVTEGVGLREETIVDSISSLIYDDHSEWSRW